MASEAKEKELEQTQKEEKTLFSFRDLLSKPEALAASIVYDKQQPNRTLLEETCQVLFRRIEQLSKIYQTTVVEKKESSSRTKDPDFSSDSTAINKLIVKAAGDDDDDNDDDDGGARLDTEILFGQVDLQNRPVNKLIKKSIKQLEKAIKKEVTIRLLDDLESDDDDDDNNDDSDGEQQSHSGEESKDSDDDDDVDEETRRIRARMERAMEDMDDEDDEEEDIVREEDKKPEKEEESLEDPAAEELNDGFFDINEMEAFADEEEEFLPDEAYGEEEQNDEGDKKKDNRSLQQKLREGELEVDESDNSEDDDDYEKVGDLSRKKSLVRRRKYREDDEIEALYSLYKNPVDEDDDDDDDDDIINATAAEIFGAPTKKYLEKKKGDKKNARNKRDQDDDSWDEHDFDKQEKGGDDAGWGGENGSSDEGEENGSDEEVAMNDDSDDNRKAKKGKNSKLMEQTEMLEKEMLAEKPWHMIGEATSTKRPVNSLLDSTPDFEVARKQAPLITIEHTEALEAVIKRRILAEDWDDVVPRELPDVGWHKKRGELPEVSQEKSKLGLGELYEREYLKKAVGYDVEANEKKTELDKAKDEMKSLFANLCSTLDALSNYHFAPRPVAEEAEVRTITQPAIAMEEVIPLHVSDARAAAPEEVHGAKRGREGILRSETELEQTDKKRIRSTKKAARRKDRKQKEADEKLISRLQPGIGLDNPYEKRKMREELNVARSRGKVTTGAEDTNKYGASSTFFQRMQEEATETIKRKDKDSESQSEKRKAPPSSSLKL